TARSARPVAGATQVVRTPGPRPQSYEPRKSPVKHLGPAPRPAAPARPVHPTRPMPVTQSPAGQPRTPAQRPPSMPPGVPPAAPAGAPSAGRAGPQPSPRAAGRPRAQAAPRSGARPPRAAAPAPVAPRRRPLPLRLLGALVRWIPRLVLFTAVYVLVVADPLA